MPFPTLSVSVMAFQFKKRFIEFEKPYSKVIDREGLMNYVCLTLNSPYEKCKMVLVFEVARIQCQG